MLLELSSQLARARVQTCGLAAVMLLLGCEQSPPSPFRIGVTPALCGEPLALARERRWINPASIRLIDYTSGTELLRALKNGRVESGVMSLDEAILLSQSLPDIRAVLVLAVSQGADMVLAREPIHSMAGLRGRRIGYESHTVGAFVLARALAGSGLRAEEVTLVPLSSDQQQVGMLRGDIEAIVAREPHASRLVAQGYSIIWDSTHTPGEIVSLLVVRGESLDLHPRQVDETVNGWFRVCGHMQSNSEEALKWLGPRLGLSPHEAKLAYEGVHFSCRKENAAMLSEENLGRLTHSVTQLLREHGLLQPGASAPLLADERTRRPLLLEERK